MLTTAGKTLCKPWNSSRRGLWPTEVRAQIIADNLAAAPQAKLAWPTSMAYEDISAEVGRIAVPTLVLAGEHDRLDPVEQHRREVLPRIAGARLEIIPGSGHLVPVDEPMALAQAIHAFVTEPKV